MTCLLGIIRPLELVIQGNTDGVCTPYDLTFPIFNFESNDPSTVYWVDFGDGSGQELLADSVGSQLSDADGDPVSYVANEIYNHLYD